MEALLKTQKIVKEKWADFHHTPCSVQLFSSLKKNGVEEADRVIQGWLAS